MISENDVMTEEEARVHKIMYISWSIARDMAEKNYTFETAYNSHVTQSKDEIISLLPKEGLGKCIRERVKRAFIRAKAREERFLEKQQQRLITLYNSL